MVKIGVLDYTHEGFSNLDWKINNFTFDKIFEQINTHITFYNIINLEELGYLIHENLCPLDNEVSDIADFYYDENHVLQGIFITCENKDIYEYNALGSQLVSHNMHRKLIIIKREVSVIENKYLDLSVSDVVNAICKTFIHSGVIVSSDNKNSLTNFNYIFEPLEWMDHNKIMTEYRYHEHKFLNYILTFYVNITEKTELNTKASIIFGKKIYGDVYITLRDSNNTDTSNLDMTDILFTKILSIYRTNHKLDTSKYKTIHIENEEVKTEIDVNNLSLFPLVVRSPNLFYVINKEYDVCKNMCDNYNIDNLTDTLNDII